jgi:hypothetical protein
MSDKTVVFGHTVDDVYYELLCVRADGSICFYAHGQVVLKLWPDDKDDTPQALRGWAAYVKEVMPARGDNVLAIISDAPT